MRYFLAFSYLGTAYHGWQRQPNALSVQEVLEDRLGKLLRSETSLVAAGRTDAGVHAREMYAHFDSPGPLQEQDLVHRLNAFLPEDISVRSLFPVPDEAHARFHATEREYEYLVTTRKEVFLKDLAHQVYRPLDVEAMQAAADHLLGIQDFQCFSRSNTDVHTYICDLRRAEWERQGHLLKFTITADRFLRNMVRAVVGTLLEVGQGKLHPADVKQIIKSKDRRKAGASVPAKGLSLTRVAYPDELLVHEPKY